MNLNGEDARLEPSGIVSVGFDGENARNGKQDSRRRKNYCRETPGGDPVHESDENQADADGPGAERN